MQNAASFLLENFMRIDKFIGNNSELSRSQIHALIKTGDVFCNDELVASASLNISSSDIIRVKNTLIETQKPLYIMLHKPEGVICATTDATQPTVLDLINLSGKNKLQIVGRLDKDTTGLVLLTDNGPWNHSLTSPKHAHSKTYRVTTADPIAHSAIEIFAQGILLHNEPKKTLPATLNIISERSAELTLCEGKYHQVKRMFAFIGNHVTHLHRFKIGQLELDPSLKPGEFRQLTPEEIKKAESANDLSLAKAINHV